MSNTSIIQDAFGREASLYEILGLNDDDIASITLARLRKAYYRRALQYHPDKVQGQEGKFRAVTIAYEILKNPETRSLYEETGEIPDNDNDDNPTNTDSFESMKRYFRSVFGQVTSDKIHKFAEQYKCSQEEQEDVLQQYRTCKGNLRKMLESVMLSSERDAQRWVEDILEPAMEDGTVTDDYRKTLYKTLKTCLKKVAKEEEEEEEEEEGIAIVDTVNDDINDDDATLSEDSTDDNQAKKPTGKTKPALSKKKKNKKKTAPKVSKARREAQEADQLLQQIRGKRSLAVRQEGFDNMLSGFANKYGAAMPDDDDPLDDAAFDKIQAGLMKNKTGQNKKKRKSSSQRSSGGGGGKRKAK